MLNVLHKYGYPMIEKKVMKNIDKIYDGKKTSKMKNVAHRIYNCYFHLDTYQCCPYNRHNCTAFRKDC